MKTVLKKLADCWEDSGKNFTIFKLSYYYSKFYFIIFLVQVFK